MLHLVRHGRPLVERGLMASAWELDPAGFDDIWRLRESGRLPGRARWFSSPEPKAVATAHLLTDGEVGIVDGLREHVRDTGDWLDDFDGTVRRAFAAPDVPAHEGWEPLAATRDRVVAVVHGLLDAHPGEDLVLVGHGTAWTLVAAELTGGPPDLERWSRLGMPDVISIG
ncbi:MAG: histidine phosphatase family protein [Nocardioides sp.]|nr:histidine phosphatase family protein [Nocardioidaceae bacterium]MCB8958049.1 histidine phosphatase family protein [Nocardioides sp.]